jgi:hypothetical protein
MSGAGSGQKVAPRGDIGTTVMGAVLEFFIVTKWLCQISG